MDLRLSRRSFLATAAVTVGVPFLPSLMERQAQAVARATPRRFLSVFFPCGMLMPDWTPTTEGVSWAMPYILAPLQPVRNKILVLTGQDPGKTVTGYPPGGHASGASSFLTMRSLQNNFEDKARTSLDQVIAKRTDASSSALPSLQLSLEVPEDNCDFAPCQYVHSVSYSGNTPLPHETSPSAAFERVFAGTDPAVSAADAAKRKALRTSVLDHVLAENQSLQAKLSASDRMKLDEYTTAIRDLETRIQAQSSGSGGCQGTAGKPAANTATFAERAASMTDLIALAFQCDRTRVISFMLGRASSLTDYAFVTGKTSPHHLLSHHKNDANALSLLRQIDRWEIQLLSNLLVRLDGMKEDNGKSVLDNSLVYCGSEVSDGNAHNFSDMPVLLAGSAGGRIKADGRHLMYTKMQFPRPIVGPGGGPHPEHTFVSILQAFDIPETKFGDGAVTGPNEDILA